MEPKVRGKINAGEKEWPKRVGKGGGCYSYFSLS